MTSKHTDDDRWLAALAGQAEPDDAQTSQAAALRRYLELQDEREAPLERKAAGRMARRLQAGLAAAQASHTDEAASPGSAGWSQATAPAAPRAVSSSSPTSSGSGSASASSWWSRGWAWCFPPLQGHGGHYAATGALAVAVFTGVMLAPGWLAGAQDPAPAPPPAADERIASAEPPRLAEPSAAVPDPATATVRSRKEAVAVASVAAPTSHGAADVGSRMMAVPDARIASPTAARAVETAAAPPADAVTARVDTRSARGLLAPPADVAAAAVAASGAASSATPRQRLSVPQPADAATQLEELLRQQDIPYAMRIAPDVWLLDADVPEAKRPTLIEPLRKFRLELPADGKLRVRITPAR